MQSTLEAVFDQTDLTHSDLAKVGASDLNGMARAAALSDYMMYRAQGPAVVAERIAADIRGALTQNNRRHATILLSALKQFLEDNPQADRTPPRGY